MRRDWRQDAGRLLQQAMGIAERGHLGFLDGLVAVVVHPAFLQPGGEIGPAHSGAPRSDFPPKCLPREPNDAIRVRELTWTQQNDPRLSVLGKRGRPLAITAELVAAFAGIDLHL